MASSLQSAREGHRIPTCAFKVRRKKGARMKNLKQWAVVAIFGAVACSSLQAQSVELRTNIPFAFYAGNTLMPAGEYQVHGQGPWVILRSIDGGKSATGVVMTNAASGTDPHRDARLDFTRYGDTYFLSTIWNGWSGNGRQLAPTAGEKELAKQGGAPARVATVLASTK
jgi:hypothetical protein